MLRDLHLG